MDDIPEDWTSEELRRLAALPNEIAPPPALEDRVVSALKREGFVGSRGRRGFSSRRAPWAAAAAAAIIAFAAGRVSRPDARSVSSPRYALFLYEGTSFDSGTEAGRVEEYRAWAARLRSAGIRVSGERLAERTIALSSGGDSGHAETTIAGERLAGYFVVAVPGWERAVAIARGCPHLRHGGRVVVRPIAES